MELLPKKYLACIFCKKECFICFINESSNSTKNVLIIDSSAFKSLNSKL